MFRNFVHIFILLVVSSFNVIAIQEPVPFSGTPTLTFANKTKIFKEIINIMDMEADQGLVSCKKLDGVFTCIAANEITTSTIYLKNLYLSIKNMETDTDGLDIQNFVTHVNLTEDIDKLLYLEFIKVIARNLSVHKYQVFLDNIIKNHLVIKSLNNFLMNIENISSIISSNYILNIWYPFQNNVSGIALYNNPLYKPFIKEIYMNQSYNTDTSEALLSAYVPGDMLHDLTHDLPYSMKKKIRIIMLFIKLSKNLRNEFQAPRNMTYLVGIAIPGLCKRNYLPIIFASFSSYTNKSGLWSQFGATYFDRLTYSGYRCILDKLSYFGKIDNYEYNSLKSDYCLVSTLDKISFKNTSWVVPTQQPIFTPYLCINKYYDIMSTYCSLDSPREFYVGYTCLDNFSVSYKTELLYEEYMACAYNRSNCLNSFVHCYNFIDAFLQNNMLWMKGRSNIPRIKGRSMIVKCLEEILLYTPDHQRMPYISILLDLVDFSEEHIPFNSVYKHISIQTGKMNGGAVYWENKFQQLSTKGIAEIGFIPKMDVTALAVLEQYDLFNSRIDFVVIDIIDILNDYGGNVCGSDVISIKVMCEYCDFINFTIFLRVRYGEYVGRGYWYWVTVHTGVMTLFCIAAQSDRKCNPETELLTFQKPLQTEKVINNSRFLRNFLSLGPNFNSLEFRDLLDISFSICTFSTIGIFNLLSFVVYNRWYKKKFYTAQISIAQLFQLSPFVPQLSSLQTSLIISAYYYGYLAELTWIFMYIYTMYMKFVGTMYCISKLVILIIGWIIPAIILVSYNLFDTSCWECDLCYNVDSLLIQFIFIPLVLIFFVNLIIFIVTNIQICNGMLQKGIKIKTARIRAAIITSIFLIIWVPVLVIFASLFFSSWAPFYLCCCILPSQGFLLFASVILLEIRKKIKKINNKN